MTGMSLLEAPEARSLLRDATLEAVDVAGCRGRVERLVRRYLPLFYRKEQRANATLVIRGLLSGLERKTCEPIARAAGVERKPIQFFVGNGKWDDEAVMAELRRHVSEELSDPQGVLVIDGSTFVHHHMTLCLLASWFLTLERARVEKKTPALTVSQTRQMFTSLLRQPPPTAREIAATITEVLRRNEETRIYQWHAATGRYPPPKPRAIDLA